jgi:pimeloyl-ACP methyl ester carboxylesterase
VRHNRRMSTFVLIPGAGGNASDWHLVESELRARGHHTIAVDLPAGDDAAGFDEYADAVVAAIGAAPIDAAAPAEPGADRSADQALVVVAHSLGGFTAPTVCERVPASSLVLVNAMIPAAGETAGDWWNNTGSATARRDNDIRDGRSPDADFDLATYFFHDVAKPVVDRAMATPTPQSDTPFAHVGLHGVWPSVPTRVLSGADDRFFPVEFQRRVARERLGITPDIMPGGHMVALSQPAELATRLAAYSRERG